jgi:mono/diheme cytochrome c family protein
MQIKGLVGIAVIAGALMVTSASAADAGAGKDVYLKKCKACHGEDGHGNEGMAKVLKTTITPLESDEVQGKSDADFKTVITQGKGKMKPVAGLSDADVANVIAYVRTLKKK